MFDVVLYEPEIPPNTGNILRLCAVTGVRLHLVQPLGFQLSDRSLRRAGLDYIDRASLAVHEDWPACVAALRGRRAFAVSTRGRRRYDDVSFRPGDVLLFGPETRGLPDHVLEAFTPEARIRIPMAGASRSLNLANAVAVVLYEAWRQSGFVGAG